MKEKFSKKLLNWYGQGKRDLPWKKTKDPYKIWISEIILQQTRVNQGLNYYLHFIDTFPSVGDLAAATEDDVLACWKGLGYYSRARNIHAAARHIVEHFEGKFPDNYKDILSLKGVGPYSAAAIASFAFDLPYAVADGNVYRVLARYYGIKESIDLSKVKKELAAKANELIDDQRPSDFNQAIMDLGAMVCTPKKVQCPACPLSENCSALQHNLVDVLPVRSPKAKKKNRYFHYLVIDSQNQLLMKRRTDTDIWKGLYDFPSIESASNKTLSEEDWANFCAANRIAISDFNGMNCSKIQAQILTHQKIHGRFYTLDVDELRFDSDRYKSVPKKEIHKIAVPKLIDWYLNDKTITLF